jgi:hypothetical protein
MRRQTKIVFFADDGTECEYESDALAIDRKLRLEMVVSLLPYSQSSVITDDTIARILAWGTEEVRIALEAHDE